MNLDRWKMHIHGFLWIAILVALVVTRLSIGGLSSPLTTKDTCIPTKTAASGAVAERW